MRNPLHFTVEDIINVPVRIVGFGKAYPILPLYVTL